MASLVTLAELKERSREAADQENSTFISDSELTNYINTSAKRLYDLLISAYGQEYYYADEIINLTSSTDEYDLPSDFYKLLGVDLILSANPTHNSQAITLEPFNLQERNRYKNSYMYTGALDGAVRARYRLRGGKISLIPSSTGANTIRVIYVPTLTNMALDKDTFDGVNGWEEFIVLETAIKMMRKEESDTRDLRADLAVIREDLLEMAADRDIGQPMTVSDVYRGSMEPSEFSC